MSIILNPDNQEFKNIVEDQDFSFFIDKTDFIIELNKTLNGKNRMLALTRPRRFGKTVIVQMLCAYYSKGCDSRELFDKLKVSQNSEFHKSYKDNLNNHNVIYWDMNSIQKSYRAYVKNQSKHVPLVDDIVSFMQFITILELKQVSEFAKVFEDNFLLDDVNLPDAIIAISKVCNTKFIVILDEWDLIYRDYRNDEKLQQSFIQFLSDMFKASNTAQCFSLVYFTGILPIKKYNSQSALNNFKEYNMLRPIPFEHFFGFTDEDIKRIVSFPNCKLSYEEIKDWYDGYKLNEIDIYNPNSVAIAYENGHCDNYWSETTSGKDALDLINMNFDGLKDEFISLINGSSVLFNTRTFQNDMVNITNKDDVYSLLTCLGYLAAIPLNLTKNVYKAFIPNNEIKSYFENVIKNESWLKKHAFVKRSYDLLHSIINKDSNNVATIMEQIHNDPLISFKDYNNELSLSYCLTTGLNWAVMDLYDVHKEEQHGKGIVDAVYVPYIPKKDLPIIIFEFKYGKSAEEAIAQIKEKQYFAPYIEPNNGFISKVLLVGLNYDPKTKKHDCIIEDFS